MSNTQITIKMENTLHKVTILEWVGWCYNTSIITKGSIFLLVRPRILPLQITGSSFQWFIVSTLGVLSLTSHGFQFCTRERWHHTLEKLTYLFGMHRLTLFDGILSRFPYDFHESRLYLYWRKGGSEVTPTWLMVNIFYGRTETTASLSSKLNDHFLNPLPYLSRHFTGEVSLSQKNKKNKKKSPFVTSQWLPLLLFRRFCCSYEPYASVRTS